MSRRPKLREGNSSRRLPAGALPAPAPAATPLPDPLGTYGYVHVVQAMLWCRPEFANHPSGGRPHSVFRDQATAEAACERLNREHRARAMPFHLPPRGLRLEDDGNGYAAPWREDPQRLLVLGDFVQDLGLPAPTLGEDLDSSWSEWWEATRPAMEPWQWEAIWAFLDREPAYRVVAIECDF